MKASRRKRAYALVAGLVVVAIGVFTSGLGGKIVRAGADAFSSSALSFSRATTTAPVLPEKPEVMHLATPANVRAIYMTQCVVGTPSFRIDLVKLIDETELNAVIIDIKDFTGKLSFTPEDISLKDSVSDACGARDMKSFIKELHEKNIYVIGRITTFQDPYYTALHPELAVKRLSNKEAYSKDHK